MRILVTGCCGFIGSHIFKALINSGHQVMGIDDLSGGYLENIKGYEENFTAMDLNSEFVDGLVRHFVPEVCFHTAASAREIGSLFEPLKSTRTNYLAYMNLITVLIKAKFKRMVLFSSMAVYGTGEPPFKESDPLHPEDVYGANKAAMEISTEALADIHDFEYVILRPHNVFGEYQSLRDRFRNFIAIFMNRIMREEDLTIFGNGMQVRAPSYIRFSLPCYLNCLANCPSAEIINIGGIENYTVLDVAEIVIDQMLKYGWKKPNIVHAPDRPREVPVAYSTYKKSQDLLGYNETLAMKYCIKIMAGWTSVRGPQEWSEDTLELINDKAPEEWR